MFNDPKSGEELEDRLFFEPVVELVQHKGASECRFDRMAGIGVGTSDELCDFEQIAADNLSMLGSVEGEVRTERARPVPVGEFAPRNMVRNALKDGLALEQRSGINPFSRWQVFVVGLVKDDHHLFRHTFKKSAHFRVRQEITGRIIRVGNPDNSRIRPNGGTHGIQIVAVIFGRR